MQPKPKLTIALAVLVAVSLLANIVLLAFVFTNLPSTQEETSALVYQHSTRYTMFIGTNNQNTNDPVMSLAEATEVVDEICLRHTNAFTSFEAQGTWVSSDGTVFNEGTLVYVFYGIDEETATSIMDEVLIALDQHSILLEAGESSFTFYPE